MRRPLRKAPVRLTDAAVALLIVLLAGCGAVHRVTSQSGSLSGAINVVMKPPCVKAAKSQTAMNECAALWLSNAQTGLSRALARERKRLPVKSVNASQAAWITYRNAECRAEAAPYRGGSVYPLIYLNCQVSLTEARTTQIQHVIATLPR